MNRTTRTVGATLASGLCSIAMHGLAHGQSTIQWYFGAAAGDDFGIAIDDFPDLDGDGAREILAGASRLGGAGLPGYVRIVSGRTGAILVAVQGTNSVDFFGDAVRDAGDANSDGDQDFLVGARGDGTAGPFAGLATVYSGQTGAPIRTYLGTGWVEFFGSSVSSAGDLDSDGFDDAAVGAIGSDLGGSESGSVRVYSGQSGALLLTLVGAPGDRLGTSVTGLGDVDEDGVGEIAAGAPEPLQGAAGHVVVFSGADGSMVWTAPGAAPDDAFGWSIAPLGDVTGDGKPDLAAGGPGDALFGAIAGYARVVSGASGTTIHQVVGDLVDDAFGQAVASAGDVDGDLVNDFLVGAPGNDDGFANGGLARLFSGADASLLAEWLGDAAGDGFGNAVAGVGDVSDDGVSDVAVGAWLDDGTGTNAGAVAVGSTVTCTGSFTTAGIGLAGTGGFVPIAAGVGCPIPGNSSVVIEVANGLGHASGALLIGVTPVSIPALCGTLLVLPILVVPHLLVGPIGQAGTGEFTMPFGLPNNPLLTGVTFSFQELVVDAGALCGVSLSRRLTMTIG
jgi:hypothetical protein